MGIQVTFDMPENIYHEVAQLAQETQRAVDDVLEEIVIRSFPAFYVDPDQNKMQRKVDAFEAITRIYGSNTPMSMSQFIKVK